MSKSKKTCKPTKINIRAVDHELIIKRPCTDNVIKNAGIKNENMTKIDLKKGTGIDSLFQGSFVKNQFNNDELKILDHKLIDLYKYEQIEQQAVEQVEKQAADALLQYLKAKRNLATIKMKLEQLYKNENYSKLNANVLDDWLNPNSENKNIKGVV